MNKINLGVILALFVLIGTGFGYSFPGAINIVGLNPVHTVPSGTPVPPSQVPISYPSVPGFGIPTVTGAQCGSSPQVVSGQPYYTITATNPCGSFPYKVSKIEVQIETNPSYPSSTPVYLKVQGKDYKALRVYKTLAPGRVYTYTFKPGDNFGGGVFPSWIWSFEVSSYPYPQFFKSVTIRVYYEPQSPKVWMYIQHRSGYDPFSTMVYCTGEEVDSNIQLMKLYVDGSLRESIAGVKLQKNVKFTSPGTHVVKCVAVARNGESASTSGTVYVKPAPDFFVPGYMVSIPGHATDEDDFVLNFSVMNIGDTGEDTSVATVPVQVYVDGNLSWSQNVYVPGGATVSLTADLGKQSVGTHDLKIIVDPNKTNHDMDYSNNEYTTTFNIVSANHPPVANFYWLPQKPLVNQTVTFYDNSTDPDNNIVSYNWSFGDGYTAHGATTVHTYTSAGLFQVTLTVTDSGGLSSTITKTLHVMAKPRITTFVADPTIGHEPLNVTFNFSASDQDSGTLNFVLDYGDGNQRVGTMNTSRVYSITHEYFNAGVYNVTLTVTDPDGLTDTRAILINVTKDHAPQILTFTANQTNGYAPMAVQFYFNATDVDNDTLYYSLDYGDNTSVSGTGNSAVLNHTYNASGQFLATLTVSDASSGGLQDTKQILITVGEPLPDLVISSVNLPGTFQETKNATIVVNISNIGVQDASNVELGFAYNLVSKLAATPMNTVGSINVSAGGTATISFDWAPPSYGNYTLYFSVDPNNKIKELNETNNDYTVKIYVEPLPDFAVNNNSISTAGLLEGHVAQINVTVLNLGHVSGNALVYLEANGSVVANRTITIDAGSFSVVNFNYNVPVGLNTTTITVAVDPLNQVVELNESNNNITKVFSITPDSAPIISPIPNQNLTVGETLHLKINATDPDGDPVTFSDNTSLFDINATTGEITYTANTSDIGTHVIEITATDGIKSSSTTFVLTVTKPVAPADLIVSSITAPPFVWSGDTVLVNVTVSNIGNQSSGPFWVSLDDGIIQYKKVLDLAPGASTTLVFNWTAPNVSGNVTLVATADVYNNVNESNETNNNATTTVQVELRKFDIAVEDLTVPSAVYVNNTFVVSFNVSNLGNQNITSPVVAYLNGTEIFSTNVSLSPGDTTVITFNYSVSSEGTYLIKVVADPNNTIHEVNETNNAEATTFVAKIQAPNVPPVANAGPEVWAKVGTPAVFNASNSYDPDGTIVSYSWNFGDGTNGTGMITNHTYASTGLYTVTLTVTDNRGAKDSDTTLAAIWNNTGLPDFVPYIEPTNIIWGENTTVKVWVYNLGNVSSNTTVIVYVDKGMPDEQVVFNGTVYSKAINRTLVPVVVNYTGNYSQITLTEIVDPNNAVNESNETNNEAKASLTVLHKPVARFSASPISGYAPLTVTFNASNSYDPDGTIVSYSWNFGDGTSGTGVTITHTYHSVGKYLVTLTVTDNDTLQSTTSMTITVNSAPSGGGGAGGGGWGGGWVITNGTSSSTVIIKTDLVTYRVGNLTIKRSYEYSPKDNETTITTIVIGSGKVKQYLIRDVIPKNIVKLLSDMQVNPYPDVVYKRDPDIGWRVGLGDGQTFTFVYKIPGKIDFEKVKAMRAPIITEIIPPTPAPPENNTQPSTNNTNVNNNTSAQNNTKSPITGLITFAQGNLKSFIVILLLAVFIVLIAVYFDVINRVKQVTDSISPKAEEAIHPVELDAAETPTEASQISEEPATTDSTLDTLSTNNDQKLDNGTTQ